MDDLKNFLALCDQGPQETYQAYKGLLEALESEVNRKEAISLLHELRSFFNEEKPQNLHYSFSEIPLGKNARPLLLLQLPSIFIPEHWSFTFYEGLSRFPANYYMGKKIIELGCGNGWISISLGINGNAEKVYGLDINPKAVTCAKINVWLNATSPEGEILRNEKGKSLLDIVEFETSDLLNSILDREIIVDRIVGCIPQVLSPDPNKILKDASENADDSDLYDLSNYCSLQGYVEDQFGLGLVAKAVVQSIKCLTPQGSLVLNLGGRPGKDILEGLFLRRGLQVQRIWSTKVYQASDTDIKALVQIEEGTQHRFEFFMGRDSKNPISAKTANAYLKAGGTIAHDLSVYEIKVPKSQELEKVLNLLEKEEFKETKGFLNLEGNDPQVFDERVNFLAHLSSTISEEKHLPYSATQGKVGLREKMAQFITHYHHAAVNENEILIGPTKLDLLSNIMEIYGPKMTLMDGIFLKSFRDEAIEISILKDQTVLEIPNKVDLTCDLIAKLKPDLVVTSLTKFENETISPLKELFRVTQETKTLLVVDISRFMDLSSNPAYISAFGLMEESCLPDHVIYICGLEKNKVYPNLGLCFLISKNPEIIENLVAMAELTYSRTPLFTQDYYEVLFNELLSFHFPHETGETRGKNYQVSNDFSFKLEPTDLIKTAFRHPSVARASLPMDENTVRLDYGENCFPIPESLSIGIFESFIRKGGVEEESDPSQELMQYFSRDFGLTGLKKEQLLLSSGVGSLFSGFLKFLRESGQGILFPTGAYGEFIAGAMAHGIETYTCDTQKESYFKFSPVQLHKALEKNPNVWVFINAPIVNPTGARYSRQELFELIKVIRSHKAKVIMDFAFTGLRIDSPEGGVNLEGILDSSFNWICLFSFSKTFAAGGLRFGVGVISPHSKLASISKYVYAKPHFTVSYAAKYLLDKLNKNRPGLAAFLGEQRLLLKRRSEELTRVLNENGWEVLPNKGGLFLTASPQFFEGRSYKFKQTGEKVTLNSETIVGALLDATDLLINGSDWTGIPNHCRFVLSVTEEEFDQALKSIIDFKNLFK